MLKGIAIGILLLLLALLYFGMPITEEPPPERCSISDGIICFDFHLSEKGLQLMLENEAGFDMTITKIELYPEEGNHVTCALETPFAITIPLTQRETLNISCEGERGEPLMAELNVTYANHRTGMNHTAQGRLRVHSRS